VKKSIWGVQVGILPLAVYQESRLTNSIALRSEISLGFGYGKSNSGSSWVFAPIFNIEPRYYYNLEKRIRKDKNTVNNSANYLALNLRYIPELNLKSADIDPSISCIPTFGMRRNIGAGFNYELALGVGVGAYFKERPVSWQTRETETYTDYDVAVALRLAIGYTF